MLRLENLILKHNDGTEELYEHVIIGNKHLYAQKIILPNKTELFDVITELDFNNNILSALDNQEVLVVV